MAKDINRVIKRESQLNLISYTMIVVLTVLVGVLLFSMLGNVDLPDHWLLNNDIVRTLVTGLLLMVVLYLVDQHSRLRKELVAIHADLETAKAQLQTAYDRLAFTHRAAELMTSLTADTGLSQILQESIPHFGADAAAVVGDDVHLFSAEGVSPTEAQRAIIKVALDAVRAGKPLSIADGENESSALAVPLRIEGQLKSVCCLWSKHGEFEPDQMEGLQLIARIIEMSMENRDLLEGLRAQLEGTLTALAHLVELRRPDYVRSSSKVADMAVSVGLLLGMGGSALSDLRIAATLHDVGMLDVPVSILGAGRPLTIEEMLTVQQHCASGALIVKNAHFSREIQEAVFSHHERIDGTGYPAGLRGDQIPLSARIISVCDAYAAMVAPRPYRAAMSDSQALAELKKGAGSAFDTQVVEAMARIIGHTKVTSDASADNVAALLQQVS
ncbi:MAG: HD domain-containing protein [Coriobacteriia bacterium]|nr:HD domain-containing protein [Coriobacteriia bacterium]